MSYTENEIKIQKQFLTELCTNIDEKSEWNQFCKREKIEFTNVLLLIFLFKITKIFLKIFKKNKIFINLIKK